MTSSISSNDVGDMTQTGNNYAPMQSATHGWLAGNAVNDGTRVEKHAFASSGNATDWSDLITGTYDGGGATNGTGTYGYSMGGWTGSASNVIQKVNLTTAATATDVANLTVARAGHAGCSSSTHGYCIRGSGGNVIDKFNMSTDADATDTTDQSGGLTLGLGINYGSFNLDMALSSGDLFNDPVKFLSGRNTLPLGAGWTISYNW